MMDITTATSAVSSLQNRDTVISPTNVESARMERVGYQTSPHAPNTPENNVCKLVSYRGNKVASFTVSGRELICLPQAFELFLKHLVGGLHTVYTKLKRLEITPVVCNVEQVRILRGVAAIQPGVNRCKLISPQEFDVLYEDCTSSSARPGRPPKRSSFINELAESSPTKMMRRDSSDSPHIYNGYGDMKAMGLPPPGLLTPFQGYPNSLSGLPFVSPYQLNLMHQAAVRMALANQLQSNLAQSAVDNTASLPATPFSKQINPTDVTQVTSPSHNGSDCHLQILLPSNRSQVGSAALHSGKVFGEDNSEVVSPSSNHHVEVDRIPTPSQAAIPTPPLSSPRDTEFNYPISSKPVQSATCSHMIADQPIKSLIQSHSSVQESIRNDEADSQRSATDARYIKDESIKTRLTVISDYQSADDILLNIISDIKSFTESVLQHQQDLIADIESLRATMLHSPQDTASDKLVKEKFDASRIIQEQKRQELEYQNKITQLLKHSKSDITTAKHRRWWADRSESI